MLPKTASASNSVRNSLAEVSYRLDFSKPMLIWHGFIYFKKSNRRNYEFKFTKQN